jgi:hypothetical protein
MRLIGEQRRKIDLSGNSLLRRKSSALGRQKSLAALGCSLPGKSREFAASHWKCRANSFRNRVIAADSEKIAW